jgi:toxin ParE1/3/4
MKIEWTPGASRDLDDIQAFIARNSTFYATRFIARLVRAADQLERHPNLGRRVPEFQRDNIREIIFQNYRIIYSLDETLIRVLAVLHGARQLD